MKKTKKISKTKALIPYSISLMLVTILVSVTYVIQYFEPNITPFLFGYGIDYDDPDTQLTAEQGKQLAIEIEANGAVLLKNENDSLPIVDKKLNVFGWGGCDNGFIYMGGGSGHGASYDETSLYKGLREAGFEINEELATAYNNLSFRRNSGYSLDHSVIYRLYEPDDSFFTESLMTNAKNFSDNAMIVISRFGEEGTDWPRCQYDSQGNKLDNNRTFAQLTVEEEKLIERVCDNFENVTVLLNTSNAIEAGFLDNEKIDSALYMGLGGSYGSLGVGKLLTGEATPSGKLADTYAYDFTTAPSYVNAGYEGIGRYTGSMQAMYPNSYSDYGEGIYIGYRWYETADVEGVWDDVDNEYGKGYEGVVQYPFGYGLSYTDFEWAVTSTTVSNNSTLAEDTEITYKVVVTNTGDVKGADVVELYAEVPYTPGEIEKSSIVLVDFAKTSVLEPGKSEELTLSINTRDLASYDCYDANNNAFMGYEVEGGEYKLSFRTDVHTKKEMADNLNPTYTYNVPEAGFKYATDEVTNHPIENRFTTYENPASGAKSTITEEQAAVAYSIDGLDSGQGIQYLSRTNFATTMPVHNGDRNGDSIYDSCATHKPFNNEDDVMPKTGSKDTNWKLSDMGGVSYDDPKWDELVSQMTVEELALISARGGYTAVAVDSVGKPAGLVVDGPSGLNSGIMSPDGVRAITYPCQTIVACTWDWKDAYKMGVSIGKEAAAIGVIQWYGPGLNTHRSPMGGRNFEYFSEDPILAGKLCAKEIQGAKEQGLAAYVKHFAANDSDTGRNGEYRWLTEQSLREIYLKPFEIAVKEGGCNAMMTSVDRIGSTRVAGSYSLLTEVLRGEWGFVGSLVTDFYQGGNVHDADENIRAGNDMQLDPNGKIEYFDDLKSATAIIALQKSAKNQLYTYVECKYLQATASGEDLGSIMVSKTNPNGYWIIGVYAFDVVAVAALGVWVFFTAKKSKGQPW